MQIYLLLVPTWSVPVKNFTRKISWVYEYTGDTIIIIYWLLWSL